ncbi:ABC transporter ATP-binding protein [Clostridioides difficile]|nr:ABC transporter ATP-binding protein [Clostridioides difficile]
MNNVIVEMNNISMQFKKGREKIDSFKTFVIKKIKGELEYDNFIALKNINLSISRGDVIGFVGLNGSGKSTLLKIVAGVQKPTEGTIKVNGKVSPLLELGAGFDNDLTGRENIYLNGLILGYDREFINKNIDRIIAFAEIENFIDTPIKNYSSGMKARLGFSIATIKNPDILIVDEVLSVGDGRFRAKSEKRMLELIDSEATVLFVSHSISQVRRLCNRVIWLNNGEIKMSGATNEVCDLYEKYLKM